VFTVITTMSINVFEYHSGNVVSVSSVIGEMFAVSTR